MDNLYYTPPTDKIFEEVKAKVVKIWQEYNESQGYDNEVTNRMKGMENFRDSFMFMVAMLSEGSQKKLAKILSDEARKAIRDRLFSGGEPINMFFSDFNF